MVDCEVDGLEMVSARCAERGNTVACDALFTVWMVECAG